MSKLICSGYFELWPSVGCSFGLCERHLQYHAGTGKAKLGKNLLAKFLLNNAWDILPLHSFIRKTS
jgi:hypothetical protein